MACYKLVMHCARNTRRPSIGTSIHRGIYPCEVYPASRQGYVTVRYLSVHVNYMMQVQ